MVDRLNLSRDQLASFLKTPEQIKQFEKLFGMAVESAIGIEDLVAQLGSAWAATTQALAEVEALKNALLSTPSLDVPIIADDTSPPPMGAEMAARIGALEDVVGTLPAPQSHVAKATSGTSFPSSPTTNDQFYRTDRNVGYFYDGTRWLSTTLYQVQLQVQEGSVMPLTATNAMWASNPFSGISDIYLETGLVGFLQSAGATAGNYFTAQFQSRLGAVTTNIGSTVSSQGATLLQWSMASVALNSVVASTEVILSVQFTETGTATCFMAPSLTFRLVG